MMRIIKLKKETDLAVKQWKQDLKSQEKEMKVSRSRSRVSKICEKVEPVR